MNDIPILETERLILRPPHIDDWPAYAALMASRRAQYMGGPHDQKTAWGMYCHDVALWSLYGVGALMFDDKESGQCIGQVGINQGPLYAEPELGWFVYIEAEGKGHAFEAAFAFKEWAMRECNLDHLVSYIDAENERSQALAERLGAVLDENASRPAPDDLVYRHF